jgi:hypothetical protein
LPAIAPHPFVLAAALLLLGCHRIERIRQCQTLVRTVNAGISEIAELGRAKKLDPGTYLKIEHHYTALAKELAPLEFQDESFAQDVADYANTFLQAAAQAKAVAAALKKNDEAALRRIEREFERLSQNEKHLARKLNAWCHKP